MSPSRDPVTHEVILSRLEHTENIIKRTGGLLLAVVAPTALASALWAWQAHSVQAGVNAEVSTKVNNLEAHQAEAQQRIEARLDEITRYLREDSKEFREALRNHVESNRQ